MSLLRDIQNAAMSDVKLADLLRMCTVLASRLNNKELAEWAAQELNGYASREDLPKYRVMDVECKGDFFNGAWYHRSAIISPSWVRDEDRDFLFQASLTQGIGALESIKTDGETPLTLPWPAEVVAYYRDKISTNDYDLLTAYRILAPSQIVGVLDTVRTRVLNFALQIEKEAPHAGDEKPGEAPSLAQERVTQIFNLKVMGGTNNIVAGSSNFSQAINITAGDTESLRKYLVERHIPTEDINEIIEIVRTEKPEGKTLGQRTLTWLGKMSGKAVSGAWSGGIAVGTEVLVKALLAYHNISLE